MDARCLLAAKLAALQIGMDCCGSNGEGEADDAEDVRAFISRQSKHFQIYSGHIFFGFLMFDYTMLVGERIM